MNTTEEPVNDIESEVDASDKARAASAAARINIPLNLENWRHLDPAISEALLWFHQHILDEGLNYKDAGKAINYNNTTVYRVLKGTYEGNYQNIVKSINSYKRVVTNRIGIQRGKFARNSISDLIFSGLDYALANNSITLIVGESGQGKTISTTAWRDANNHGRSVLVEIPPIGGAKTLLRALCRGCGHNVNGSQDMQLEALLRSFNSNRILILDEAHRLLPGDTRRDINPVKLEIIRYIHDKTKCGVGLIATQRFDDTLKKLKYQFEQVLGRVGLPVRLYRHIENADVLPILQQYFPKPTATLQNAAFALVNDEAGGRLRTLGKLLEVASKIASASKRGMLEDDFFKSLALRKQAMGEIQHAAK